MNNLRIVSVILVFITLFLYNYEYPEHTQTSRLEYDAASLAELFSHMKYTESKATNGWSSAESFGSKFSKLSYNIIEIRPGLKKIVIKSESKILCELMKTGVQK